MWNEPFFWFRRRRKKSHPIGESGGTIGKCECGVLLTCSMSRQVGLLYIVRHICMVMVHMIGILYQAREKEWKKKEKRETLIKQFIDKH